MSGFMGGAAPSSFMSAGPSGAMRINPVNAAGQSSLGPFSSMAPGLGMAAFGAGMNLMSGFAENRAYSTEAGALKAQANEAIREAQLNAEAQAHRVRQFAADQAEEYSSSGVTMAGTPAAVVADTERRGQQEVDAITRRGAFQAQLYRTQANQLRSAGRSAILGGILKSGLSLASYRK